LFYSGIKGYKSTILGLKQHKDRVGCHDFEVNYDLLGDPCRLPGWVLAEKGKHVWVNHPPDRENGVKKRGKMG